jgi:stage IV sporulation protein FB
VGYRDYYGGQEYGGDRLFQWSRSRLSWSVGRLFGITIWVHVMLVLMYLLEIAAWMPRGATLGMLIPGMAMSFVSILLHEFGHCFAARAVRGEANEIVMWLGGLASCQVPQRVWSQMACTLGGPAVSLALMLLPGLWLVSRGASPWMFLPFVTHTVSLAGADWWIQLAFEVNHGLFWFNMLMPIFPMDAGRLVYELLWLRQGERQALWTTVHVGLVFVVGYILLGMLRLASPPLLVLAFGGIECWTTRERLKREREQMGGMFGYDFSEGHTSLERQGRGEPKDRGPSWRERRAVQQAAREREAAANAEAEVDRILDKINAQGLQSLTDREKRTLNDASRRKRGG